MPACPSLKALFGDRYRVTYEESYAADCGTGARAADPWLMVMPCRAGHIFPWGAALLAASVDGHSGIARRHKSLPCCEVKQDGADGMTLIFESEDFGVVAAIMRPRVRRKLSPEHRQRLAVAAKPYRFGSKVAQTA